MSRSREGISYDESKALSRDRDPAVRADLAGRADVRPEILYYLAADPSSLVRRRIAGNARTPEQADRILAGDPDEAVRLALAEKVTALVAGLPAAEQAEVQDYVVETLETLARDQATRVRRLLAEALAELTRVPPSVIRRLARDVEDVVACPVLEYSTLLSERDLIEIIEAGCASGRLSAISRRRGLGATVADAVVATEDRAAVSALLANDSAQIREQTLDSLVDRARRVTAWQPPLVGRAGLSPGMVRKLAGFVAEDLLDKLRRRSDLDPETAGFVAEAVQRRLAGGPAAADATPPPEAPGELDEAALLEALARGDRALVLRALVLRAGLPEATVERMLATGSAKGITALAWKAALTMRAATQLQLRLGGVPPGKALRARGGADYPLSAEEMTWQLEFFETLSGKIGDSI